MKGNHFAWLWLVPLLWLVTWLGARGLNADAYWLDETWSLYSAGAAQYGPLSPADIWTRTATEDFGGPGYHFLLAAWGALVGWTPFAARASSLLAGTLALAWIYRLGREMVSPLAGISAAVLFGGSAFTLYFLHELRTYMLSVLLIAFVLWAYWRLVYGTRRPGFLLQTGFVLAVAGLLYTHYYLALILPVIGVYHLLLAPKNGAAWWRVVGLATLGGVLFLPWVTVVLAALTQFSTAEAGAREPALTALQLLQRTALFFSSGAWWLLLLVGALALVALRLYRRQSLAAWCWTLLALAVLIVVNDRTALVKPGRERYLLLAWPPLALLGGIGIAGLVKTRFRPGVPILLTAWLAIGTQATLDGALLRDTDGAQALPWDALADTLRQRAQPGDVVAAHLTAYNWALDLRPLEYYLYGLPVKFTALESLPGDNLPQAARAFVGDAANVWVATDKRLPATPRLSDFTAALAGEYAPCGVVFDLPRLRLDWYKRFPAEAFDPAQSAILRFGDSISLTHADITAKDNTLSALLLWSVGADVPPYTYSVGLHVLDAAGELVAQADYGLPLEAFACRQSVFADLPPGDYELNAVVYNWSTGDRLPGVLVATGETGDGLALAAFSVHP
ncbi:MAG: glycosyltransferase family 39 protein [Chloroflexi bacterium]|nr:glycosyltransferase family 39 protein [Chloroflexota bacterium]